MFGLVFFFFSSRRRHTRYWRDWSSDVCSSDLRAVTTVALVDDQALVRDGLRLILELAGVDVVGEAADGEEGVALVLRQRPDVRSEERRVGKECRSRWSPYH